MSMLRNVLTYMGLGPDEDYDDGYLYESADNEIDLTEDEDRSATLDEGPFAEPELESDGEAEVLVAFDGDPVEGVDPGENGHDAALDPHAQRERPGWLAAPPAPVAADAIGQAQGRRKISIDDDDPETPDADTSESADDDDDRSSVLGRRSDRAAGRRRGRDARPLRAVPPDETPDDGVAVVDDEAPLDAEPAFATTPAVREVKPRALAPQSFGDAKILADEFKAQVPVIMNLQSVDRELARRLIDFASGICYAMDGSMEKIASQVFLLTPQEVEVSDEERRRLDQRGYDR